MTVSPLHLHLVAIGGTGMAPLAALLSADGHRVTGSDGPLYPPMSTLLEASGIAPFVGFDPAHLEPRPDLVVIGNAVPRSNVEAVETERLGLPRISMPEALARFYLADRRPLVVCGTHGKTTTTALAAWTWSFAGRDPGYLVGGVPHDLESSFHRGGGERFVLEGDEYNAAYFDRGPKFLHYRPDVAIVTSVEHDHADLYPTAESFRDAFRALARLPSESGRLVAWGDSEEVRSVLAGASCPVLWYGANPENDVAFEGPPRVETRGTRFTIRDREGRHDVRLGVWGVQNALNALAVWAAARHDGIPAEVVAEAFARFRGVRRRQEIVADRGGVVVIDDFAHHPTAVAPTLDGLRGRFPGRRLVVAFEPRSLTAGRAFLRDGYLEAFAHADRVLLGPAFHHARLDADERLDFEDLAAELTRRGTPTDSLDSIDELGARLGEETRPGDVVVTMSSGSFEGLARRLGERLGEGVGAAPTERGTVG